jgi:cytoskeletal protein RodZ
MKEIGLKLKEKREENGVSLEEAASDLQVKLVLLENIEDGNREAFSDVLALKTLIKDYAKYLGIDGDALIDQFNEYLFEQTSRISLTDIEEARKLKEEKEKDMKILSPYTTSKCNGKKKYIFLGIFVLLLVLGVTMYIGFGVYNDNKIINSEISYKIGE